MKARRPDPQDLADLPPLSPAARRHVVAAVIAIAILFALAVMIFGFRGSPPGESYNDLIDRWMQEEFRQPHNSARR